MGSFKYGSLPTIWMDHWYVECHMWIMSRSHFFTSRSKIYKRDTFLNCFLKPHSKITALKKQQEEIKYLAFHDTVTKIGNRAFFHKKLRKVINNAKTA